MTDKKYPFLDLGPVNAPYMDEMVCAIERVVRSGRYIGGVEIDALEDRLCRLTGASCAVGVSNGLDALRLIFRAYIAMGEMKPGDEVIIPGNTYIASVLAVSDAGLTPVLIDPDVETSNLDTTLIERAITDRTRAIMPVHLYGRVCWDERIVAAAKAHSLKIIEDNAQAIGAESVVAGLGGGYVTGNLGDAAAFSFYPTKNVGALGDAGAVTTSDSRLASHVRALANYGSDRRYHNILQGFNCRLDPVQAAVLGVKLEHLDEENGYRRAIAEIYCAGIKNPEVTLPRFVPQHVFHQYVVHVADRDAFTRHLDRNGVGWDMHYAVPPHLQPCYADAGKCLMPLGLDVTELLADRCVSLPVTRCTSAADARDIVEIINEFNNI